MKTTDHQPMPGDTPVCLDPRHSTPCFGECRACDEECDPRFRSTLANADRRAELDSELQAMGAVVIRVEDLGKALEAYETARAGGAIETGEWRARKAGDGNRQTAAVQHVRREIRAAHLARLALGEAS